MIQFSESTEISIIASKSNKGVSKGVYYAECFEVIVEAVSEHSDTCTGKSKTTDRICLYANDKNNNTVGWLDLHRNEAVKVAVEILKLMELNQHQIADVLEELNVNR